MTGQNKINNQNTGLNKTYNQKIVIRFFLYIFFLTNDIHINNIQVYNISINNIKNMANVLYKNQTIIFIYKKSNNRNINEFYFLYSLFDNYIINIKIKKSNNKQTIYIYI